MLNPAYARGDGAIEVALPGLAGLAIGNRANFSITDLVRRQASGDFAVDLEHFYNLEREYTQISPWTSVPFLYLSFPAGKGRVEFYFRENIIASMEFKTDAVNFLLNGNSTELFKTYNTDDAFVKVMGYKELAAGYAMEMADGLSIGVRGKLLFGSLLVDLNNWSYGIETSERGDVVSFSSQGTGKWSLPTEMQVHENRLKYINSEKLTKKYLKSFNNPGIAVDMGMDYSISERSRLSVSITDLGAILFSKNSYKITQDDSYDYSGFDLSNSLDINKGSNYIDPRDLMSYTKDDIRNVFRSFADSSKFVKSLVPRTAIHWQYDISDHAALGITNQTAFFNHLVMNTFSLGAKQNVRNFTFFENVNLHGADYFSLGGGMKWEVTFGQLLIATDNILALYHPASQQSFSFTVGASFLINKPENRKNLNGKFSPHFPFFENKSR